MQRELAASGLNRRLGSALFPPQDWHQSLSHPLDFSDDLCQSMMNAGARVDAAAFTIVLNRVRGEARDFDSIHWEFRATKRPPAFDVLLAAVRKALQKEDMGGNTPHVTISYGAPGPLPLTKIHPIPWRIDELLLVKTQPGTPRYHTLARWPLRPAPAGVESQRELW